MTAPPRLLRVSAVLLAAGAASRMGHRPKPLIEVDGVALVRRLADALMQVGVCETVVVLGHYAQAVESALVGASVRCVLNPRPDEGQISSLRVGLQSVSDQSEAVMVLLSDQPLIGAPQLRQLIDAYLARPPGVEVLQPQVEGLPGNPVLFSQRVRQEILAQGPEVGCRQWQAAHPDRVQAWASTDRSYRIDLDTAEDLAAVQHELGASLAWPTSSRPQP
jgi:molybdenum cofactor cytidylyltransferase